LAGARATLDTANTPLIGGHSSEGDSLALGFSVTGKPGAKLLTKTGGQPGDHLILTKAIGTGIAFAADMRAMAKSSTVEMMIASMLISNQTASHILVNAGATGMTDVSGFGLVGHLQEMVGTQGASLIWSSIPLGAGVLKLAEKGFASSLLTENRSPSHASLEPERIGMARSAILFDPQTAGGLLASVPPHAVKDCLQALRSAGYTDAADIGLITSVSGITLNRVE
jgi:selenide, water dikinase